jgi:predicted double-glycine peptidase
MRWSAGARRIAAPALVFVALAGGAACSGASGARGQKFVRSLQEIRHDRVVLQKWDLSCGSAALSTLLTFDVDDPVAEEEIIATILRRTDPVKIRARKGFSLLDLKRFAVSRGHEADGYGKLDMKQLAQLGPAIVPTVIGGNDHFVVFRGVEAGHVLLADPGFGNRSMTIDQFESVWPRRIAFVVKRRRDDHRPVAKPELTVVQPPLVRQAAGALR